MFSSLRSVASKSAPLWATGVRTFQKQFVQKSTGVLGTTANSRLYSSSSHEGPEPTFFEMVELYFDKAVNLLESKLIEETQMGRISLEEKKSRVKGILQMIKPCNSVIALTFPIKRGTNTHLHLFYARRDRRLDLVCQNQATPQREVGKV